MFRRFLMTAALLIAAQAVAPIAQAGAILDRVLAKGELKLVLLNDYPPFSFINDKNELAGFDIDVAKALAAKLGVKLSIDTPAWEVIAAGNWHGRWDICICSMTPTAERAEVLDFPVKYYDSPAVLAVHKDETRIKGISDISGKSIAVQAGASYENYLQKTLKIPAPGAEQPTFPFDKVTIVPYETETVAFQDLALGGGKRVDGVITNIVTAKERIDATGTFKIVSDKLYVEPNWVAVEKGDAAWSAKVKAIIEGLKADGTLTAISKKWIGVDITG